MRVITLILVAFALATSQALAIETILEVLEPENTTIQCNDVLPFNDDFGWNGKCSCRLSNNSEYIGFGEKLATFENTLFVETEESPLACDRTITVYEIQDNGSLQKQTELIPNDLRGSFIGATGKDLVTAVSYEGRSAFASVFGRTGGKWQELYTIDLKYSDAEFPPAKLIGQPL